MVFACQLDSFQRTFKTKVKSCEKGSGENKDLYEVICEDSILFPEGGGQPWDTGFINDIAVHKVLRRNDKAVIYVGSPLEVEEEVTQTINWERRFDHMQQHSGQHLITAVINAEYKIDTTSWWLGEKISHIELDITEFKEEQLEKIEKLVNEKILENVPVVIKLCEIGDKALENARTRGLPEDVSGPIRIVEIVGLEDDLCCGTHVSCLGQLQAIKLLYAEKGKKNKTNLFFLSGGRVLNYLSECLKRERKLTELLNSEPTSHPSLVEKLQRNLKQTNKKFQTALKDVAALEANKFKELKVKPEFFCHYNKDGDASYLDCFWRILRTDESVKKTLFVLASGEEKGNGNLAIYGNEDDVKILGPKIAEILHGKGSPFGNRFQAKVTQLYNFRKVEYAVRNYFHNKMNNK